MPNIRIVKLKVRRGSDAQRRLVVLEQGELGYTTDTGRLFIGNGSLSGGATVGTKVHSILTTSNTRNLVSTAYENDLVYENNFLYQLTGTDYSKLSAWAFVGSKVDNESIEYDANRQVSIKDSGISTAMIQTSAVTIDKLNTNVLYTSGGLSYNFTNGISANINSSIFQITSANVITIKGGGITSMEVATGAITESNISSSALSKGLIGGSGATLSAHIDEDTIVFNSNNEIAIGSVKGSNINLAQGMGIGNNDTLTHIIQRVDPADFNINNYRLELADKLIFNNRQYNSPNIIVDKVGLIRDIQNNICLPLSSNSSDYGGFATQLSGSETRTTVTASTGVNASNVTLSSAGFMVVRMGTPNITTGDTRNFLNAQYLAIPVFTVPASIARLAAEEVTLIYPYEHNGYRAWNEDANGPFTTGELSTGILTGVACSGDQDYTGYSIEYDVYSTSSSLKIGDKIAATTDVLSTAEIPTLSGWWAFGSTLYFVNSTNTITITGNC